MNGVERMQAGTV